MTLLLLLLGAACGSFLNVCIHRLPRGESLLRPRSHCVACLRALHVRDLIPLVSFIVLRGRCRFCCRVIPAHHLVLEAATPALFLAFFEMHDLSWSFVSAAALASVLLSIAWIDWQWLRIPNALVLIGLALGSLEHFLVRQQGLAAALIGLITGTLMLALPSLFMKCILQRENMGAGDLKLAAVLGLYFGGLEVLIIIWCASALGAAYGLIGIGRGKLVRSSKIPFGSFLCALALVVLLARGFWSVNW